MNKRLRLAGLGRVAAVMSILAMLPAQAAQAATVKPNGLSGWGPIVNWGSRGCVDVRTEDGPYNWGAHVQNWRCSGVDEQQWYFWAVGDGSYYIVNKRSGLCLDAGGFWSVQWGCTGTPQQSWQIGWQPGVPAAPYP